MASPDDGDDSRSGIVYELQGGVYTVRFDDGSEVEASMRGKLKRGDPAERVVVGDRVVVSSPGDHATIEAREPRQTRLLRAGPARRGVKVIAANIDRLMVVVSAARPDPNAETIDRLFVLGELGGLAGALVINKTDLDPDGAVAARLTKRMRGSGYPVVATSIETGEGLDDLAALLCEGSSVLVGPSGVGKSSLIARIEPGIELRVGGVSEHTGTGRHTTVSSRLIALTCGGIVADTPGFSDVAPRDVPGSVLAQSFPEFRERAPNCRFRECSHTHEPDCAVKKAIEDGELDPGRLASYVSMLQEMGT